MAHEDAIPAGVIASNPQPQAGWHNEALPLFQSLNDVRNWLHKQTRETSGNHGAVRGLAHVGGRVWSVLCVVTNIISAAISALGSPFTAVLGGNYCGKKFVGSCRQVGASFVAIFVDNAPESKRPRSYRDEAHSRLV